MKSISTRTTTIIGVALLALWVASFGLSYLSLGQGSLIVALGIAGVKAALVVLFFMELVTERFTVKITLIAALAMITLLMALMISDVTLRSTPPLLPAGRMGANR